MFDSKGPVALVADIGGTNVRLALAGLGADDVIVTAFRQDFRPDDYAGLAQCVQAYLDSLGAAPRPDRGAFGVASPVAGDLVRLTNRDWSFSVSELGARFGLQPLKVVNDFVAVAYALAAITPGDWRPLKGPAWPERLPQAVSLVGPGTGLGVGALAQGASQMVVLASEGGHASFAPQDALEVEILKVMLARFPRVSNERLLSGPGMENLYAALAEVRGKSAVAPAAPAIVEAGLSGDDPLARETLERFCLMLGSVMGDIALVQGAGAVAIAGGIAPRLIDFLDTAAVRARFEAKGRAQGVMSRIPIALITHPEPGLLGAATLILP